MTHTPPPAGDPTDRYTAFAAAAMNSVQHQIDDPYLRELVFRVARGELTGDEAARLGEAYFAGPSGTGPS